MTRLAAFRRLMRSYNRLRNFATDGDTSDMATFFRFATAYHADFNRTLRLFGFRDPHCICDACIGTRRRVIQVLGRLFRPGIPEEMTVTRIYVKIPTEGMPTPVTLTDSDDELAVLQQAVGGCIEAVGINDHTLYVNEEGKIDGLPFNLIATDMTRGVLRPFDVIVGDAILVGPLDAEGESTSVDPTLVAILCGEVVA